MSPLVIASKSEIKLFCDIMNELGFKKKCDPDEILTKRDFEKPNVELMASMLKFFVDRFEDEYCRAEEEEDFSVKEVREKYLKNVVDAVERRTKIRFHIQDLLDANWDALWPYFEELSKVGGKRMTSTIKEEKNKELVSKKNEELVPRQPMSNGRKISTPQNSRKRQDFWKNAPEELWETPSEGSDALWEKLKHSAAGLPATPEFVDPQAPPDELPPSFSPIVEALLHGEMYSRTPLPEKSKKASPVIQNVHKEKELKTHYGNQEISLSQMSNSSDCSVQRTRKRLKRKHSELLKMVEPEYTQTKEVQEAQDLKVEKMESVASSGALAEKKDDATEKRMRH